MLQLIFTNGSADFFPVKATFSDGAIANGDFDAIDGWSAGADNSSNVTKYSSEVTSWSTSGFNDITLNSDALADITNNDNFTLAIVENDSDFANSDQGDGAYDISVNLSVTITLDYTVAATGYGNDVNGVASANIAKVIGVATADIEKIIGV